MSTGILFTHQGQLISSNEALRLCQQEVSQNANIDFIFFYFDSLNIVKDTQLFSHWQNFKQQHALSLIACSTAAHNRQIKLNETGPFILAGLSEFYARLHKLDKLIQL